ncbi:MAG: hypothetical protein H7251_00700, partial [Acetobacteraceae bacterium]|nr:hypothetical protein [Acetobacteraceae bacterium]
MSMTNIIAQMDRSGALHQVLPGGNTVPMVVPNSFPPMTEAEIHAAAMSDPDALPITDEDAPRMKRVTRAKTLRRALGLTQDEFAT